jgi:hypothetical protein
MESQKPTYNQSTFEKCLGNEGLRILRSIFKLLEDLAKAAGTSSVEFRRRHLETIFSDINDGKWTATMITVMKFLMINLTIQAEEKSISTSVEICNSVSEYLEKELKPFEN